MTRAVTCGALVMLTCSLGAAARTPSAFRVCADPNNLPFSNDRRQGFENKIAELAARDLGQRLEYTWWPQRRGFIRATLDATRCDVVMGVPARYEAVLPTASYYRSTYVVVTRESRYPGLTSLDDPRLAAMRVAVQIVGGDYASSPPAAALAARGLTANVVGYPVTGDYSQPNPPARILDAVARGTVDAALVWGPLAGYFARRSPVRLDVRPLVPSAHDRLPFTFEIAMGVRRGD